MREIDQLKHKVERQRKRVAALEKKLGERARSPDESPFGQGTPSSQLPFKPNATEKNRQRKGGARPGHRGHGRKKPPPSVPAEKLTVARVCCKCGGITESRKIEQRHVRDYIPEQTIDRRFLVETRECKNCGELIEAEVPGVLPRAKYSNSFVAHAACQHYLDGRTQGDVCKRLDIGRGAFNHAMQNLADMLQPCSDRLVRQFLDDVVRFGDETGFREDGVGRYAWLLSTPRVSLFLAGQSRASSVPLDLFEPYMLPETLFGGVLVVDRYAAYNCLPFELQYCYAHLKRDVDKLQKQFPDDPEVKHFCGDLIRQLVAAMRLQTKKKLSDRRYYASAAKIKAEIIRICDSEARHAGVQELQNVFRKNRHRLYHWAHDRRVPPDNNYSERSLRPLVIARKLSFGTQSAKGSRTRTILMSVLHSLKKQGHDPATRLCEALNLKAQTPEADLVAFLFPPTERDPPLRRAPDEGIHAGIPIEPPAHQLLAAAE
jgi:transposase